MRIHKRNRRIIIGFVLLLILFGVSLLVRAFFYEPFKIPSNSMMPTLMAGDYIWVAKHTYGIHMPFSKAKMLIGREGPKVGDVIVFESPKKTGVDYVKRVIGLPGDHVAMVSGDLFINQKQVLSKGFAIKSASSKDRCVALLEEENKVPSFLLPLPYYRRHKNFYQRIEMLDGASYFIQRSKLRPDTYDFEIIVPKDTYFVLGDNRDRAFDSRQFGVVMRANIIGKVSSIWLSLNQDKIQCASPFSHEGSSSIRWYRLGRKVY